MHLNTAQTKYCETRSPSNHCRHWGGSEESLSTLIRKKGEPTIDYSERHKKGVIGTWGVNKNFS